MTSVRIVCLASTLSLLDACSGDNLAASSSDVTETRSLSGTYVLSTWSPPPAGERFAGRSRLMGNGEIVAITLDESAGTYELLATTSACVDSTTFVVPAGADGASTEELERQIARGEFADITGLQTVSSNSCCPSEFRIQAKRLARAHGRLEIERRDRAAWESGRSDARLHFHAEGADNSPAKSFRDVQLEEDGSVMMGFVERSFDDVYGDKYSFSSRAAYKKTQAKKLAGALRELPNKACE